MSFLDALESVSRDDRFKATVYAMNTLLVQKGVYTNEEFENLFVEWVTKEHRRLQRDSASNSTSDLSASI